MIRGELQHTARRGGVGHRAEGEIPLDAPSVGEVEHGVTGLDVGDILDPRYQIGQMAEEVLGGLGGGVGGRREGAEGGDIGEVAGGMVVESHGMEQTHVDGGLRVADGGAGGLSERSRQTHGHGEIVGASRGDVAQGGTALGGHRHKPRHGLVEGAVPSAADDGIVALLGGGGGHAGGVSAVHGGGDGDTAVGVGFPAQRPRGSGGQRGEGGRPRHGLGSGLTRGGLAQRLGHRPQRGSGLALGKGEGHGGILGIVAVELVQNIAETRGGSHAPRNGVDDE